MKKFIKIFVITLVFISLVSIMFPVIPPHSWYSKYILTNNSILSKLGLNKDQCKYQKAQILIAAHPAYIYCFTTNRYKHPSDEQKIAVDNMRSILEKDNWRFVDKESWKHWDITYSKGLRKIRIYPYDWDQSANDEFKLIVSLQ